MTEPKKPPPISEQPFVQHLIELRDRLLRVVLAVVVIFLGLFAFANDLYIFLAEPLLRHMPEGTSMIATEVASPFLTPFKLTLVLSVFVAVPFILYQAWGFIAPGLYQREQRLVFPLLFSSTLLFYTGMAFAYFVVFPLVFGFLLGVVPEGVAVMTDISRYLDFVLKMFFAFGLAFEVPIATILVVWSGMATAEDLGKKRPYIIVGAFVFGMLLTPPDVISQTLLAVPMWILFELGLIFSRWYTKDKTAEKVSDKESAEGKTEGNAVADAGMAAAVVGNGERIEPSFSDNPDSPEEVDGSVEDNAYGDLNSEDDDSNESGHQEFEPLTEEEMDAELDRIEAEEALEDDNEEHDESEPVPDTEPKPPKDDKTE
ncbi:MAG: twin-arginine translocase subunit TatC [Gammaproteobacteria bacterium]